MRALARLVILMVRLAVTAMSTVDTAGTAYSSAFTGARGSRRDPHAHYRDQCGLVLFLGRSACAGGARARRCYPPRAVFDDIDHHIHLAAPAVQLTRGRRILTFDETVVQMLFDDDRLSLTLLRTSECDLRVKDVSPRKSPRRLADGQSTRGVGRPRLDVGGCGQWTTEQIIW